MNQYAFRFRWCYSSQTRSIPAASANNRHPCLTYYSALHTMFHYGRTVPGNINCPWELILSSPPECLPLWYSCLHKNFTARSIPRNQSIFWKHKEYRLDHILKACKIYTYCPSKLTSVIQSFPFGDYVCPILTSFFHRQSPFTHYGKAKKYLVCFLSLKRKAIVWQRMNKLWSPEAWIQCTFNRFVKY